VSVLDKLRSFAEAREADAVPIRSGLTYGDVREALSILDAAQEVVAAVRGESAWKPRDAIVQLAIAFDAPEPRPAIWRGHPLCPRCGNDQKFDPYGNGAVSCGGCGAPMGKEVGRGGA
jgi:hypothetical protein